MARAPLALRAVIVFPKRSVEAVEDALQTQPCERYTCDTAKGCVVELTCAAGCTTSGKATSRRARWR